MTAQVPAWAHSWGNTSLDGGRGAAFDADGNLYVAGFFLVGLAPPNTECLLLKYDAAGVLLWAKSWGGDALDAIVSVAVGNDGYIYTAGGTTSFGIAGGYAALLLKYDSDGNLIDERILGGENEIFYSVELDGTGAVYASGHAFNPPRPILAKFRTDGSFVWVRALISSSDSDIGHSLAIGSPNEIVIAGTSNYSGEKRMLCHKYDSSGTLIWALEIDNGGANDFQATTGGGAVMTGPGGDILLCGTTDGAGAGDNEAMLLSLTSGGAFNWGRAWGGTGSDKGYGIALKSTGQIVISGETSSFTSGVDLSWLQFDPSGSLTDDMIWDSPTFDTERGYGIATRNGRTGLVGDGVTASGAWQDVTGAVSSLTPTLAATTGQIFIDVGNASVPAGSEGSPVGTIDTGGGNADILVLMLDPLCAPPVACTFDAQDVNCDGAVDVLDVVEEVNVAFRGHPATVPCCPYQ